MCDIVKFLYKLKDLNLIFIIIFISNFLFQKSHTVKQNNYVEFEKYIFNFSKMLFKNYRLNL